MSLGELAWSRFKIIRFPGFAMSKIPHQSAQKRRGQTDGTGEWLLEHGGAGDHNHACDERRRNPWPPGHGKLWPFHEAEANQPGNRCRGAKPEGESHIGQQRLESSRPEQDERKGALQQDRATRWAICGKPKPTRQAAIISHARKDTRPGHEHRGHGGSQGQGNQARDEMGEWWATEGLSRYPSDFQFT